MKLTDRLGNELIRGDAVSFHEDQIVGVITEIDSGEIARPFSIDGKVTAEQRPPMCMVKVQFATVFIAASGAFDKLIKIHKPSSDVNSVVQ